MLRKRICLFLSASWVFPIVCFPQFTDDFSDGDFLTSPTWQGDTSKFDIHPSGELWLNAPVQTDNAYLSTPSSSIENAVWEFRVRMDFNPSSSNFVNVYLVADQSDLSDPLNGYYVQLGNSEDDVRLCRQNGTSHTVLIDGINGTLNTSLVNTSIRVTRDAVGNWELLADTSGGTNFISQGTVVDSSLIQSWYGGVYMEYTSSRSDKIFFDDFSFTGFVTTDTIRPVIDNYEIIHNDTIRLEFSEPVELSSAELVSNYSVNPGWGNPVSAVRDTDNIRAVYLVFSGTIIPDTVYTFSISGVQDYFGNTMADTLIYFADHQIREMEVLITEVMVDPEPVVGLSPVEYIELYNTTKFPIELKDWRFISGITVRNFPVYTLLPYQYVVISDEDDMSLFPPGTLVLGISSFPSMANASGILQIRDADSILVHAVHYSESWYDHSGKSEGGWSLEMIDRTKPCMGNVNWTASVDSLGGTPGKINSVDGSVSDTVLPYVFRTGVIQPDTIILYWNEPLASFSPSGFSIDQGLTITDMFFAEPFRDKLYLVTNMPLQPDVLYTIIVDSIMVDCGGRNNLQDTVWVQLPEPLDPGDLVINEVLFNPLNDGVDYVEIYNRSNRIIDLQKVYLSEGDTTTQSVMNLEQVTGTSMLTFPGEYVTLSTDQEKIKPFYTTPFPKAFIDLNSFPSYPNDEGTVAITTINHMVIDMFAYNEDMHFDLLNSTDGVSLERLDINGNTNDPGNWHSAAQTVGFGTPGYQNSQTLSGSSSLTNTFQLDYDMVSPDNDGYQDLLVLRYALDQPGYRLSLDITDATGQHVRTLVENQLLATEGFFTWDGLNDDGGKARTGIHVLHLELIGLDGEVEAIRKVCVVATRF